MAEITTGPQTINATSSASGRAIAIMKSAGQSAGVATASISESSIIMYVKGTSAGATNIQSRQFTKYKTVIGVSNSVTTAELFYSERDIQQDVADCLPQFYQDFPSVVAQLRTFANESTRVQAKLGELLDQFFVDTATIALDRWETLTEIDWIPERSEISRRHFITSKLRGAGTVTTALLNEIVDAFYGFEVTEKPEDYAIHFKLVGRRGIPKNLEDIQATVNDVIPAHIGTQYEFTYLPWNEVTTAGLTWEQAGEYTASGLEEAFLIPQGGQTNE